MLRQVIFVIIGLTVSACDPVGPDFERPEVKVESQFATQTALAPLRDAATNPWWKKFQDPILNRLVDRGLSQNLNIKIAQERIIAADLAVRQTGWSSRTDVSLSAQSSIQRADGDTDSGFGGSLNGQYVFDIFGGAARRTERAAARLDESEMDAGVARLAVIAEITSAYIQARYNQNAAAITRSIIDSRRETLAAIREMRAAGRATELDLQSALSELASEEARLPAFLTDFDAQAYRLATLLAEPFSDVRRILIDGAPQPRPRSAALAGIPADLLRNRPDVRAAEARLAQATAAIGIATADLYPSLRLSGFVGLDGGETWSLAGNVVLPVLQRGAIKRQVSIAQSEARSAELAWRGSVQQANEEVLVALRQVTSWRRQSDALNRATRSRLEVSKLTEDSFRSGQLTLTDVLDAQNALANSRLGQANALRGYALSWADVHIRTGQGWLEPKKPNEQS